MSSDHRRERQIDSEKIRRLTNQMEVIRQEKERCELRIHSLEQQVRRMAHLSSINTPLTKTSACKFGRERSKSSHDPFPQIAQYRDQIREYRNRSSAVAADVRRVRMSMTDSLHNIGTHPRVSTAALDSEIQVRCQLFCQEVIFIDFLSTGLTLL